MINELLEDILGGEQFTDAHQDEALRWVAELGQRGWLERFKAVVAGLVRLDDLPWQCELLACAAATFERPEVITAMAGSPARVVRGALSSNDGAGAMPAHRAASVGSVGVINALATFPDEAVRATLAAPDARGRLPAHWAASANCVDGINALAAIPDEAVRASLGAPDPRGLTPLHLAADERKEDALIALLDSGNVAVLASLTALDQVGRMPMHIAAERGLENVFAYADASANEVVRASLTEPDQEGRTPAHWATMGGRENVVDMLAASAHPAVRASAQAWTGGGFAPEDLVSDMPDPGDLALARAVEDLQADGSREAINLKSELQCPVSWMPFALAGPQRPVQFRSDAAAGVPMEHCLSAAQAEKLLARRDAVSLTFKPVHEGYMEAPRRQALVGHVAQAYQAYSECLPMAREQALQAYAEHEAALATPEAAAAQVGAAPRHYLEVLAGQGAAPGRGAGAEAGGGGPQRG